MKFIWRCFFVTLAILALPYIFSGVEVKSFGAAILAAVVLGLLNLLLKPVLVFFTFPLTVLSFGLFLLVINGVVFQLVASMVPGLEVESFLTSIFASILVSVVTWISNLSVSRSGGHVQVTVTHPKGSKRPMRDLN